MEIYNYIHNSWWKYKISNLGNVFSVKNWIVLKWIGSQWYLRVSLKIYWKIKLYFIHKLVAEEFIEKIQWKNIVNHINGIKKDNRVENLEWVTAKENTRHAWKNWLCKVTENNTFVKNPPKKWMYGKLHSNSKKIIQSDIYWNIIAIWDSMMDAQRNTWVNNWNISNCCKWLRKIAGWFSWEYKIN